MSLQIPVSRLIAMSRSLKHFLMHHKVALLVGLSSLLIIVGGSSIYALHNLTHNQRRLEEIVADQRSKPETDKKTKAVSSLEDGNEKKPTDIEKSTTKQLAANGTKINVSPTNQPTYTPEPSSNGSKPTPQPEPTYHLSVISCTPIIEGGKTTFMHVIYSDGSYKDLPVNGSTICIYY